MSGKVQANVKVPSDPAPSFAPMQSGLLHIKSLLGGALGLAGEFTDPRRKRLVSQPPLVQAKLTINQPNDRYEQEADRVAAQVAHRMNDTHREAVQQQNPSESVEVKHFPAIPNAQYSRVTPVLQPTATSDTLIAPNLEIVIKEEKSRGQALPNRLREQIEHAFGASFSSISIHTDAVSDKLNRSLNARAFTIGNDIFFRNGAFNPGSKSGKELIAHELAHAVQQENLKEIPLIQRRIGIRTSFVEIEPSSGCGGTGFQVGEETPEGVDFLTQPEIHMLVNQLGNPELGNLAGFISQGTSDEEIARRRSLLETTLIGMHTSDDDYIFSDYIELGQEVERRADVALRRDQGQAELQQYIERHISGSFGATEWGEIRERARRSGLTFDSLVDMLAYSLDIVLDDAKLISYMCLSDNTEMADFRGIYSTGISTSEEGFRRLQTNLLDSFLSQVLTNNEISNSEFFVLAGIRDAIGPDLIEQALGRTNLDDDSRSSLHRLIRIAEAEQPTTLENQIEVEASLMTFQVEAGEMQAVNDPSHEVLQSLVVETQWDYHTQRGIDVLLEEHSSEDIRDLFVGMNIDDESANLLGRFFSSRESNTLGFWRSAQSISFQVNSEGMRQLTGESSDHLEIQSLPEFVIPSITPAREYPGTIGSLVRQEDYEFSSGETASAIQMTLEFRGRNIVLIGPEDVLDESDFFDLLYAALSRVPLHHLGFLTRLIIDPSRWATVTGEADRDGETVTLYLSRQGANITPDVLYAVTIHEFGHLVHTQAAHEVDRFWERWMEAIQQDRIEVSRYARDSHFEDFAESYVLFISGGCSIETTRQRHQHRCDILDEINRTVRSE